MAQDCNGGCFVNGLPDDAVARWQTLINATKRLGHARRVHVYQNSGIDTSLDANTRHADSTITDAHGASTAYRKCVAGMDMPLFFGNLTNSYGRTLEAVYRKVLEIGFDGVPYSLRLSTVSARENSQYSLFDCNFTYMLITVRMNGW